MPRLISTPTRIEAAGEPPKLIEEFVGRVNTNSKEVSIAKMKSPSGWREPGQCPEFEEYTLVLKGMLRVEYSSGVMEVNEGQAVITQPGEWVRYSTPGPDGCEYLAICIPAFSPDTVNRD